MNIFFISCPNDFVLAFLLLYCTCIIIVISIIFIIYYYYYYIVAIVGCCQCRKSSTFSSSAVNFNMTFFLQFFNICRKKKEENVLMFTFFEISFLNFRFNVGSCGLAG